MAGHRYSEEFKQQALALVGRRDKPATQVARAFGAPPKALYKWMEAALWFVKRFPPLSSRKSPHGSGGEFAAQQEPTALPLFHERGGHGVALAVEQEEMPVMREAVNYGGRHL